MYDGTILTTILIHSNPNCYIVIIIVSCFFFQTTDVVSINDESDREKQRKIDRNAAFRRIFISILNVSKRNEFGVFLSFQWFQIGFNFYPMQTIEFTLYIHIMKTLLQLIWSDWKVVCFQ